MVCSQYVCRLTYSEATHEVVSQPDTFRLLLSLVPLYSAFDGPADGAMDAAGWLWSIIEALAEYCEFQPPRWTHNSSCKLFTSLGRDEHDGSP
jgi:hypothetical protein